MAPMKAADAKVVLSSMTAIVNEKLKVEKEAASKKKPCLIPKISFSHAFFSCPRLLQLLIWAFALQPKRNRSMKQTTMLLLVHVKNLMIMSICSNFTSKAP